MCFAMASTSRWFVHGTTLVVPEDMFDIHIVSGCLIAPEIRIGNDEADLRLGVCHRRYRACGSVVVQEFVEMIVCRVHPGCLDGISNLGWQIIEAIDVPLESSQAF
jgi:hypothetical protein